MDVGDVAVTGCLSICSICKYEQTSSFFRARAVFFVLEDMETNVRHDVSLAMDFVPTYNLAASLKFNHLHRHVPYLVTLFSFLI
jgi:hypothetical protein